MCAVEYVERVWALPTEALALAADQVYVWRGALDLSAPALCQLYQTLTPDEVDRAARIREPARRARFIAARGLLRTILGRYLTPTRDSYISCMAPVASPHSCLHREARG